MKVTTLDGTTYDLGKTEDKPTVGITDFSLRATDTFGVTTVVKRPFSRQMSVKLGVPTARMDDNARLLTTLRARSALWVADPRFAWLSVSGYYEDLSIELPSGDLSYCTLKVSGLAEKETVADTGADPSANGRASTLRFVQPVTVTDAVLVSSSVAESDAAGWSASATYPLGTTVVRGHRIYESLAAGNAGADPLTEAAKWLDTGPTNRWAMFDEALGSSTIATAPVVVVLKAVTAVSALALLDTNAATVRVQAPGYDRTVVPDRAGKALFLDFAAAANASVTVTATPASANPGPQRWDDGAQWMDAGVWRDSLAAGDGTVTIGTFLFGAMKGLGTTETSPTAGITDYSVKETDEFGEVTVVERAWAKNMAVKAQIASSAVDVVANRIAAVRAQPALWIGDTVRDSLIVYGFFRDFSIEIGENVSKLSLSIEGLSKAAPIVPAGVGTGGPVAWPDITDPDGTKPTNNADKTSENTSKDTAAVGGRPTGDVLSIIDAAKLRQDTLENQTIPAINQAVTDAGTRITAAKGAADAAKTLADAARSRADAAFVEIGSQVTRVDQRIDAISASGGYDDTAVYAEVSRVDQAAIGRDVALGSRVDTVSASVTTTDGNLRALVQTKEDAAVSRDDAISRRIDTIIAEGGGGSEGVDTVARAEITRVEQAAITRDAAVGTRIDTVQASFTTIREALNNDRFDAGLEGWQATAGLVVEPSYHGRRNVLVARNGLRKDAILGRAVSITSAKQRFRIRTSYGNFGSGAAVFYAGAAFFDAAGAYVAASDGTGNYPLGAAIQLTAGVHGWFEAEAVIGQGLTGTNPISLSGPTGGSVNIPAGAVVFRPILFLNYASSSAAECAVDYFEVEDITAVVSSAATAKETTDALARADLAFAEQTRLIEASLATVDGRISASASDVTRAFTNADIALGSRTTSLEATASAATSTLNPNPDFSAWSNPAGPPDLWDQWAGGGDVTRVANPLGRGGYAVDYVPSTVDSGLVRSNIYCGNGWFVMEAIVWRTRATWIGAGVTLSGQVSIDFMGDPDSAGRTGDSNGDGGVRSWSKLFEVTDNYIGPGYKNFHMMGNWAGFGRGGADKTLRWMRCAIRPASDAEVKAMKADAALNNPGGVLARITANESVLADLPNRYATAQRASNIEASVGAVGGRISSLETVTSNGTFATAARAEQIASYAGGVNARVDVQAGTIASLQGRAAAYWRVESVAGNNRAQLTVSADANSGAGVDIVGDVSISGNLLVGGSVITAKIADNATKGGVAQVGGSKSFTTASTLAVQVNYTVSSSASDVIITAAGAVLISPGAAAATRANLIVSVNGSIVLSEQIGSRGILSNFNYPIPTGGLQGACNIQMTITATGGNGQDDPHIINRPTLIVQEFKK